MIISADSHCSAISANAVAGYLPANQDEIFKHLLLLLEVRLHRLIPASPSRPTQG